MAGVSARDADPAFDGILSMLDAAARESAGGRGAAGGAGGGAAGASRPFVTLCFAQSVDGSIAPPRGYSGDRLLLSGPESMRMTHRLRAWHDGILVGIGTVILDDPSLTVRLCPGASPQPIIVDKDLRTPLTSRLMSSPDCIRPIIVTARGAAAGDEEAKALRHASLEAAGAIVVELRGRDAPADGRASGDGGGHEAPSRRRHVALGDMLAHLSQKCGLRRVMVEGGCGIITSFLREQVAEGGVVDAVNVTVAPLFVGGTRAWNGGVGEFPRLRSVMYVQAGEDMVMQGLFGKEDVS